jgi:class I fructose-bisphosphate aldolase
VRGARHAPADLWSTTVPLGTTVRLSRLFANPSGNLFGVAIDHFVGYGDAPGMGLHDLPSAIARSMAGTPDTMTMTAGTAKHCWAPYAGKAALIVEAAAFTPDDRVAQLLSTPADAIRLGADAIAVAIPVRGATEGRYLQWLSDSVRDAAPYGLPVVAHIYPRDYSDGGKIVFTPEQIAWAVRCGIETGVDVIKVGYPGDPASLADIIASCPTPIVIAGGPKTPTLRDALALTHDAIGAGAKGAVVGRNIWGSTELEFAARAYRAVIHQNATADEALVLAAEPATA